MHQHALLLLLDPPLFRRGRTVQPDDARYLGASLCGPRQTDAGKTADADRGCRFLVAQSRHDKRRYSSGAGTSGSATPDRSRRHSLTWAIGRRLELPPSSISIQLGSTRSSASASSTSIKVPPGSRMKIANGGRESDFSGSGSDRMGSSGDLWMPAMSTPSYTKRS